MDGVHGRMTVLDDGEYRRVRDSDNRRLVAGPSTKENPSGLWGMTLDNRAAVTNASYDFMFQVGHGNGQLSITSTGNRVKHEKMEMLQVSANDMQQQLLDAGLPPEGKVSILMDDEPPTQVTIEVAKLQNGDPYIKDVTIGNGNTQIVIDNPGDYSPPKVSGMLPRNQETTGVTIAEVGGSGQTSWDGDRIEGYIAIDPKYLSAYPPPLDNKDAMLKWRVSAELFQFGQQLESSGVSGQKFETVMTDRAKSLYEQGDPKLKKEKGPAYRNGRDEWVKSLDVVGSYRAAKAAVAAATPATPAASTTATFKPSDRALNLVFDQQTGQLVPPKPQEPEKIEFPQMDPAAKAAILAAFKKTQA